MSTTPVWPLWDHGKTVVATNSKGINFTLRCLRSDEVPLDASGRPVVPWFRLNAIERPTWEVDVCQETDLHQQVHSNPSKIVRVVIWEKDYDKIRPAGLNYGSYPPPRKAMKEWPHDCPRCNGRECALQLATTWDCRNGCFK